MQEITTYNAAQLPDTLEDLTQFVLVGKAKLQAYMLKLQTVNKLSVAQEIRDQTLKEAQEVSTALIAAEQRIGELLLAIPKQSGGDRRSESFKKSGNELFEKTKEEKAKEMGYSHQEVIDYQQMAKNPEVVQKVIENAIANGEVVTKTSVMREIKFYKDRLDELSKQKPEKVVQKVEVVPEDYDRLRKKAKEAEAWEKDYRKQQEKTGEKQREILRLQGEIKRLQEQTVMEQNSNDMTASAIMFAMQCRNFIESVGGYVFISEHLQELPERERNGYITSAKAVHDWAHILIDNIERGNNE